MNSPPAKCQICDSPNASFNYGANTCNACKMFFRRVIVSRRSLKICAKTENCGHQCRCCRFRRCVSAGMKFGASEEIHRNLEISERVSDVIARLRNMDVHREARLRHFYVIEDPSLVEYVADERCVEFRRRTKDENPCSVFDWAFHEQLTTIDFIRKFELAERLDAPSLTTFVTTSFFTTALFFNAFRSYRGRKAAMSFVDGSDIIPPMSVPVCSTTLLTNLRSRLVGKLIELRVSVEEFLLLVAVFVCNPYVAGLSENAKSVISSHQQVSTSALLQLCQINCRRGAPARFCELLSIMRVISQTARESTEFCLLFGISQQPVQKKRIFEHTHFP